MVKLSVNILGAFFKQKTGSFILISMGMFVTVLGTILILSRGVMVYQDKASFNNQTKTVDIEINEALSTDSYNHIYDFFLQDEKVPEVKMMLAVDVDNEVLGAFASGEVLGMAIPYGRYFNEEENGERVVLYSDAYLHNSNPEFIIEMLGQDVYLLENDLLYSGIGRYNATLVFDMLQSREVTIPLQTFVNDGFSMYFLKVVFDTKPTERQLEYMKEYLENYDLIIAWPEIIESDALRAFFSETMSHLLILFICHLTLMNLLKYWIETNYRKFYIYYLCGCTTRKIWFLLMLNTFYMYILPTAIAVIVYKVAEAYFVPYHFLVILNMLPILLTCLVALILAMLTTWRVADRQIKKFTEIREVIK